MAKHSDVLVQNFRPGVAERLGISYDDMKAVNEELVYLSISGYGPSGPYSEAKVYDFIIQAQSGVGEIMRDENGGPTQFHNLMMDKVTALNASQSITAALLAVSRGRGGQHIELAMLDAAVHFLFPDGKWNQVWQQSDGTPLTIPVEWANGHRRTEYDCVDGKVACTYAWDQFVDRQDPPGTRLRNFLMELGGIDVEDFMEEGWVYEEDWLQVFEKSGDRMRAAVAKKTCAEMFELAMKYQVPCGRFLEGQDVFSDPQIQHNGTILPQEHPVGGSFVTPRPPAQFHGTPSAVGAPASLLGTETDEVLAEFGYTEVEVAAMRGNGVV